MGTFDFERLDVYKAAVEFVALADRVGRRLPRGRGYLLDQLQRAATSIALNIAEGAGEYKQPEKARFYRMARRSTYECAAVLDVLRVQDLCSEMHRRRGRELLERIGPMLTRLARTAERKGSDSGSGSDSDSGTTRKV